MSFCNTRVCHMMHEEDVEAFIVLVISNVIIQQNIYGHLFLHFIHHGTKTVQSIWLNQSFQMK